MYKCEHCGEVFEEDCAEHINTTYEDYYGCPISSNTFLSIPVCPNCRSEEINEYYEDEEENEEEE